ncbi:MerR family transcriptional regulator [Alteromonas sp. 5E99-2]|uniref:MerR family transcriptional regulator n=1 Tax=Alteromonas sp. 5E99-2 TaxID=2817683 RepID=UPI001A991EAB|nr:MerR family transcriptional regulator [Alteromonas sp. 5E99-2]MBO1256076.1 MerR family transcriptional regulator [Alteromonas sp. 5E99-2]
MKKIEDMTVKDMALLSGVTIRTLHHYDDIGLLKANRTESGYRIYTEKHALRLQQILIQKSFGLPLEDIARNLDDANFDTLLSLQQQRNAVVKQAENINAMVEAIDMAIKQLTDEANIDLRDIFKGFDPSLYEEEVEQKWGGTEFYKESQNKTKDYTPQDWERIKREENAIWQDAAHALRSGVAPTNQVALELAQRYRKHIDNWFYTTSVSGFAALAELWESDARFIANIDKFETGLAKWIATAVRANYGYSNE